MSRQSHIEQYFRSQKSTMSQNSPNINDNDNSINIKGKRKKLSLFKSATPSKSPKVNPTSSMNTNLQDIINLISDDEDIWETPRLRISSINNSQNSASSEEAGSDASQKTIPYSLSPKNLKSKPQNMKTPVKTPRKLLTPKKKTPQKATQNTPQKTDERSSASKLKSPSKSKSPSSAQKYFSPSRNRAVVVRQPDPRVKRSLSEEMDKLAELAENEVFANACKGMDDKTIFLLTIINKCLKDPSLCNLLDPICQGLLQNCLKVVKPGMRLVCRLYWRKEGWYKVDKIKDIIEGKEPDEQDFKHQPVALEEMINSLMENGLLVQGDMSNMSFSDYTSLLGKDELKQICKELKLKHADNKQDAIAALAAFGKRTSNISNFLTGYKSSNSKRVLHMMNQKTPPRYKLTDLARTTLYKLYILMYLGINFSVLRDKKLEFVLLCDKVLRETYPVDKSMVLDNASVVFRDRHDFKRYVTAHVTYEEFLTKTDIAERCDIVKYVFNVYEGIEAEEMARYKALPVWLRKYTSAYVYIRLLEEGIQDLKKSKNEQNYQIALDILNTMISNEFRRHKRAHWYDEKALILHSSMGSADAAAKVLIEGFKSEMAEEAKDIMRPRARKLTHQKNIVLSEQLKKELQEYAAKESILEKNLEAQHIYKQPMERTNKRGKVKFETRTAEGRDVQEAEEYCIAHYINSGEYTRGEHWEGRIITNIFFLLFWDIIYSKPANARGVFLSHFQMFPLDMFTETFYENRKEMIDERLRFIEMAKTDELLRIMHDKWEERPKCELSGISRSMEYTDIAGVVTCLAPRALSALCRRLATDYKYAHSGFPDLTVWNQHTKQIKFVEVKTDTDKPSMKQIQWMQYLRAHGIATEFCYLGANTTRQKCRKGQKATKRENTEIAKVKIEKPL